MNLIASFIIGAILVFGGGLALEKGNVTNTIHDFYKVFVYSKPTPIPTQIPISTTEETTSIPTPKHYYIAPTIDPDPITDCNFQHIKSIQLRNSVCSRSTECEIETGHWYFYESVEKCKKDQVDYWSKYVQNNYKPISNTNYNYIIPTYAPIPTLAPYVAPTSDPRCSQAYNKWIEYRSDFLVNKMNSYNNSAEAMLAFENERQYVQNLINSYGCSLMLQ